MNTKLKIGFFGHSIAQTDSDPNSNDYIQQLIKKYDAELCGAGTAQCSEERILFQLKKTKDIDIAVIYHANPKFVFIPSLHRDVSISTKVEDKFDYELEKNQNLLDDGIYENAVIFLNSFISRETITFNKELLDELTKAIWYNKRYMSHPDLVRNRYFGALMHIDSFVKNRNIKVIHAIDPEHSRESIPSWFNFSSGIIDNELQTFQHRKKGFQVSYGESCNGINEAGNKLMIDILSNHFDRLLNT